MLDGIFRGTNIYFVPWLNYSGKPHIVAGFGIKDRKMLGLFNNNPHIETIKAIDQFFLGIPLIGWLSKIGIYFWLTIAGFVMMIIRKAGRFHLCFPMLFMIIIGCMLSPVDGYYRYAYPLILSIPVVFEALILYDSSESADLTSDTV